MADNMEVELNVTDGETAVELEGGSGQAEVTLDDNAQEMDIALENNRNVPMNVGIEPNAQEIGNDILNAAESAEQARLYKLAAEQAARDAEEYALRTSAAVQNLNGDIGELEDVVINNRERISALETEAETHVNGFRQDETTGEVWLTHNDEDVAGPLIAGAGGGTGGGGGTEITSVVTLTNDSGFASTTIAEGAGLELSLTWGSTEDGTPTGDGTLTVTVGGVIKETRNIAQGSFTVQMKDYLATGSNRVVITVTDSYGKSKLKNFTITVVQLNITSSFDASVIQSGLVSFPYTPYGAVSKTIHFELDGTELEPVVTSASGREMSYVIGQQAHGGHGLRVWFTASINGQTVTSNELFYDIMWVLEGNSAPVITSSFAQETVSQYSTITVPFMVYTPGSQVSSVTVRLDGTVVANMTDVGREMNSLTLRLDNEGAHTITIQSGATTKSIALTVTPSEVTIEAETENLALHLTSSGRTNLESQPGQWTFTKDGTTIDTTMTGFNFVSNGWVQDKDGVTALRISGGARAVVNYKPFEGDFRSTGKTIEIEFAARDVRNYDAVLIDCMSGGRGFRMTAQHCTAAGEQSGLDMEYADEQHIRLSLVYGKRSGTRLMMCYINGIGSAVVQYPGDDDFSQSTPVGITIGSDECTVDVYCIRVYNNDLNAEQIEGNWIADTQDGQLMLQRYAHNNIRDAYGNIDIAKLPSDLPYMTLIGPELPTFKGDKKKIDGEFVNPLDPSKNFSFSQADIDVQGTSSQYYEVKNFKMKFKTGFITSGGTVIGKFKIRDDSIPVSTFTMKADVASSEGANNTVLARLFEDANPYKTPEQEADSRVRQAIDGFPMVMFWNNTEMNSTGFVGKYNFNNDKGTPEVFGFGDTDESWEFRNNTSNRSLFISDDFTSMGVDEDNNPIPDWLNDFEARNPDTDPAYTDKTQLEAFVKWVASTNQAAATGNALEASVTFDGVEYTHDTAAYRLAKFRNELPLIAELESFTFYYVFTYVMLLMDNRAKNMFLTFIGTPITAADIQAHPFLQGMRKKATLPAYDFDSALGINNEGKLAFAYYLEDIDQVNGEDVYNGQKSVLWINFRQAYWNEIRTMYQSLRSSGAMSAEKTIAWFSAHQGKWPEAVFNEDAYYKYLRPVETGNKSYLEMMLGSKETQRDSFVTKRFRYIDSQMNAGDALRETVVVRGYAKANISLTPFENTYVRIRYGSYDVSGRATAGQVYLMENPLDEVNDTEIITYLAGSIADFGDLSGLKIGYGDFSKATKVIRLQIGNSAAGYDNPNLKELSIGNLKLLRVLDLRNVSGLGSGAQKNIDLTGCTDIREVYLDGTNLTGVTLPNGGSLTRLHLPGTIANLTLRNQTMLSDFVCPDFTHITTLWLDNPSSAIDTMQIVEDMPTGGRVRLFNFHWELEDLGDVNDMFDKLDTMRGLDQNGNNTDRAQVYGTIHVAFAQTYILDQIAARYPDVTITYDASSPSVVYKSSDGTQTLLIEAVQSGGSGTKLLPDAKESTAQYTYTPAGWSRTPNGSVDATALDSVTSDRIVYAVYTQSLRSYEITMLRGELDGNDTITVLNVAYGQMPNTSGLNISSTRGSSYSHIGWSPAMTEVTGPATYTALFSPPLTLTFRDWDGTLLFEETLAYGRNGTYNTAPTRESTDQFSYSFSGWSTSQGGTASSEATRNVTADRTVWAVYAATLRSYTITFVRSSADGGGTLQSLTLNYGTMPSYSGNTPESTRTDGDYEFSGWTPELTAVTGAATYTAVFRNTSIPLVQYLAGTLENYESDTATEIGEFAFYNMISLKTVRTSAATIGASAFSGCSNLESIDLTAENAQVVIKASVLNNCDKLNAIIIRSRNVASPSDAYIFNYDFRIAGNSNIYVPDAIVDNYKAATNFANASGAIFGISEYPFDRSRGTITDTLEQMAAKIAAGTADYAIGATKSMDLGTEGTVRIAVVGKNADELADGSGNTADYTFGIVVAPNSVYRFNPELDGLTEGTGTIGGWPASELRATLHNNILPLIPEALRNLIVPVKKYSCGYDTSGNRVTDMESSDSIFTFSVREFTRTSNETKGPKYSDFCSKSFNLNCTDQNGNTRNIILRTAADQNSVRFRYGQETSISTISVTTNSNSYALCFGFCVTAQS